MILNKGVSLLPDNSNWVTSRENKALLEILKKLEVSFQLSRFPIYRNIYFADKYQALKHISIFSFFGSRGCFDYYHGDPSITPEFAPFLNELKSRKQHFFRIRVSHTGIKRLLYSEGVTEQVFCIPIGIELDWFTLQTTQSKRLAREDLGIPNSAVVIGSFQKDGNGWGDGLEPKLIKGPDIFLETIANLQTRIPELFILLTGPARGFVKKGLEGLGVPYKHYFISDYREIGHYFQALDAYLITSREEGGPKAVLESMACGIPLISTPVGQGQDLIVDKKNGWIASGFDPEELATLTLGALANEHLENLKQGARRTAQENTYESQLELWREFFQPIFVE